MEHRFRLIQDGMVVAQVESEQQDRALGEIEHYAAVYSQDGPVKIERRRGKGSWREYLP
jgi:hypothetical protein